MKFLSYLLMQWRGVEAKLPGQSVYLTGYTPETLRARLAQVRARD